METHQAEDPLILLETGDLVLESLRDACDEYDVDSGAIASGIGTFRSLNSHYVPTPEMPTEKKWRKETHELVGAWEVGTIDGMIANGDPHPHLVAYNGDRTVAGHLEEGTWPTCCAKSPSGPSKDSNSSAGRTRTSTTSASASHDNSLAL
jgi:predicted DNA-binding protein with PD1-like motif